MVKSSKQWFSRSRLVVAGLVGWWGMGLLGGGLAVIAQDSSAVVVTTSLGKNSPESTPQPVSNAQLGASNASVVPLPPSVDAKAYVLLDANTGYLIAEKNSQTALPPASLTKVMTLYLIADALRAGRIKTTDEVLISERAWRTGGSRMFVQAGSRVAIADLIRGIAVASGNDATVAMAEHLADEESSFVDLMNQTAQRLGMTNTHYADSSGLPREGNYSTAADLATLARAWLGSFSEYYAWFGEKWIDYNGIRQPNRNRLLWRDEAVDGFKTGHTDAAGYCLIASAQRGDTRLIAVILGAKSDSARASQSLALLNYGFRFFETRKLAKANQGVVNSRVFLGKNKTTPLGVLQDFYLTVPVGERNLIKVDAAINRKLKAPVTNGQQCGELRVYLGGEFIQVQPLVALQDNLRANPLYVAFDYLRMLWSAG